MRYLRLGVAWLAPQKLLFAMLLMLMSGACFSLMNVVIRFASQELHTTQIVFLRNALSVLLFLPFVLIVGKSFLRTTRPWGHVWRGTIGLVGMQLWFICVALLPLNEATALSFTAPILTSIFAIVFLGEQAGWRRWCAIGLGFIGAMIIIRPNPHAMEWGLLLVPCATAVWAVAAILVKGLTKTEPPTRIVFYMAVIMSLWALPISLPFWQTPSWEALGLCLIIAMVSTAAHLSMVAAYARAAIVVLMPLDFFRLIFTALFAYIAFEEIADPYTWLGGAVIVMSAVYIAWREARQQRKSA
jgi:drug/metabolite transporter (DMT)-like permease